MDKGTLTAHLRTWCIEFDSLGGDREKLPGFLAQRIIDAGLTSAKEDWDVTTARIRSDVRKVKVRGQQGGFIQYDAAEGQGFGILPVAAFTDNAKLAEILDRLNGRGPMGAD